MKKDDQVALGSTAAAPTGTDLHDGGPAFPQQDRSFVIQADAPIETVRDALDAIERDRSHGLSVRDYFAAKALAGGMRAFHLDRTSEVWDDYDDFAQSCYRMADAMLKARKVQR